MHRFIWSHLRRRAGRTLALLSGLLVTTTGFIVLSGTTATARLEVTGAVQARHPRGVRHPGASRGKPLDGGGRRRSRAPELPVRPVRRRHPGPVRPGARRARGRNGRADRDGRVLGRRDGGPTGSHRRGRPHRRPAGDPGRPDVPRRTRPLPGRRPTGLHVRHAEPAPVPGGRAAARGPDRVPLPQRRHRSRQHVRQRLDAGHRGPAGRPAGTGVLDPDRRRQPADDLRSRLHRPLHGSTASRRPVRHPYGTGRARPPTGSNCGCAGTCRSCSPPSTRTPRTTWSGSTPPWSTAAPCARTTGPSTSRARRIHQVLAQQPRLRRRRRHRPVHAVAARPGGRRTRTGRGRPARRDRRHAGGRRPRRRGAQPPRRDARRHDGQRVGRNPGERRAGRPDGLRPAPRRHATGAHGPVRAGRLRRATVRQPAPALDGGRPVVPPADPARPGRRGRSVAVPELEADRDVRPGEADRVLRPVPRAPGDLRTAAGRRGGRCQPACPRRPAVAAGRQPGRLPVSAAADVDEPRRAAGPLQPGRPGPGRRAGQRDPGPGRRRRRVLEGERRTGQAHRRGDRRPNRPRRRHHVRLVADAAHHRGGGRRVRPADAAAVRGLVLDRRREPDRAGDGPQEPAAVPPRAGGVRAVPRQRRRGGRAGPTIRTRRPGLPGLAGAPHRGRHPRRGGHDRARRRPAVGGPVRAASAP